MRGARVLIKLFLPLSLSLSLTLLCWYFSSANSTWPPRTTKTTSNLCMSAHSFELGARTRSTSSVVVTIAPGRHFLLRHLVPPSLSPSSSLPLLSTSAVQTVADRCGQLRSLRVRSPLQKYLCGNHRRACPLLRSSLLQISHVSSVHLYVVLRCVPCESTDMTDAFAFGGGDASGANRLVRRGRGGRERSWRAVQRTRRCSGVRGKEK